MKNFLFLILTWSLLFTLVIAASRNHPRAAKIALSVVSSIKEDLEYDENGKLLSFHLVFPQGSHCGTTHIPPDYQIHTLVGNASTLVFPEYDEGGGGCVAACIERGTDRSVAGHVMPHQHYNSQKLSNTSTSSFQDWFQEQCNAVLFCLRNYWDHSEKGPIEMHWIHPHTQKTQLAQVIEYGDRETDCVYSFLGHEFELRYNGEELIGNITLKHSTFQAMGDPPIRTKLTDSKLNSAISHTIKAEWEKHLQVKRTFSALGFAKGKLPRDVFASMGAWFYNNRQNKVLENWTGKGFFVNWWESKVYVIPIPPSLANLWQGRLGELVAAWAGVPVEQTMMYGMRQYQDGARLLSHVDRLTTHAVSLIVNIDQGNLTEPWPVEIFDHNDRLHEVLMEPGEIVYYESAKNLHSRNRPLNGEYYVNLFTHYRPIQDGDTWYEKSNPMEVPYPLLTVEGECRLEPVETTKTDSGQLGIVQQVHCDDKRLGNYVSPTFFQATSSQDLFDWWSQNKATTFASSTESFEASTTTIGGTDIEDNDEL